MESVWRNRSLPERRICMSKLTAGFARLDITPSCGMLLAKGSICPAEGILDPLTVSAVAFDNGEKRAVVISADLLGIQTFLMDKIRSLVADAIGTVKEAVFVHCTHTHLGPILTPTYSEKNIIKNPEYAEWLLKKVRDVAVLAVQDLDPAKLFYTRDKAKNVAFVRRYRMKDGTYKTNPGRLNPDIDCPVGEPDENVQLLLIKRENAPEIGIVNFQVHPDVIGGDKISADYPHFVRDTYEKLMDNSRCMYINGAQGDTNDVNVRLPRPETAEGRYDYARYMGRKIAMAALANYELAEPLEGDEIRFAQKNIFVKYNKGRPEQIDDALYTVNLVQENEARGMGKWEALKAASPKNTGVKTIESTREAVRIVDLMDLPDEGQLCITAVRVGDVVFAGLPGEQFTNSGREIKQNSKFTLTIPACCANGYQGYFPTEEAYGQGGYERATARFAPGTAEKLIAASVEIVNSL